MIIVEKDTSAQCARKSFFTLVVVGAIITVEMDDIDGHLFGLTIIHSLLQTDNFILIRWSEARTIYRAKR